MSNFVHGGCRAAISEAIPCYFVNQTKMNRKQFLKTTAVALAGVAVSGSFLESCKKSTKGPQGPTVNFTIDLNDSKYAALASSGGYVYNQGVIIARINDMTDGFIAVASACTHQGCTVTFATGSQSFVCPCHGGTYDLNGNVVAGPPPYPIKRYTVTRNGNIVTVAG